MIQKVWLAFTGLVSILVIIFTLLLINATQLLSAILVRPFSEMAFRRYNTGCAAFIWRWCIIAVEKVQAVPIIFTGDELPQNENAVIISNHQELTDVLFMLSIAERSGRLRDLKWFGKDALKHVPAFGWGLRFIDCVFLKRDWTKDQTSIEATFENLYKNKIPLWLINFMEGTRATPSKIKASQAHAERTGLKPLKNLLLPRPRGFIATIRGLKEQLHAVYDVTLSSEDHPFSLKELVFGPIRPMHIHIRRYPIEALPKSDAELTAWCRTLFENKDQMIENFKATHQFPATHA
ncbi:MAG: 1-acyl-sn-glycerol-3-phosphate acyltransferase [Bdellovibrio sp.]|nr:1-acyl-sn-glycerol-3-phosphate acyltransferase [Bdellovibrio sp.]